MLELTVGERERVEKGKGSGRRGGKQGGKLMKK